MKNNKILITGGTGLLGKALIEGAGSGCEILATYIGNYDMDDIACVKYVKLDVQDKNGCAALFQDFKPDVVIHAASIGSPDFAEKNKDLTWNINVNGTKLMASLCEQAQADLIYISSNGIYDGNNAPYADDDIARPVNYYGQTKLEGEAVAKKANIRTAIVRPILMYGWNHPFERSNVVTISLSKLAKGEKVFAYDDVHSNPLFAGSCAQAIWGIIDQDAYEAFNLAGKERVSIYELIRQAAEIFNLDADLITPVQQGYFQELVPRPIDTSYRTDKMERVLGIKPLTLNEGLGLMRDRQ